MRARLAEVAEHARVSEATVSRVLNDKPGVSAATREQVLTALDVLGYDRPSRLRRRRAGTVGLVLPELDNPVFPAFVQHIEAALVQNGYLPIVCTQTPGGLHEDDYVRMLLDRGVAGIVFVSGMHADETGDSARYVALRDRGLPIVLVNGFVEGIDAAFVSNDDVASMSIAVAHLVSQGHRQIGLALGPSRFVPVRRKAEGFVEAMRAASVASGAEAANLIEYTLFTVEGGASAAARLAEKRCTAIICGSDLMALGAIRALRERGLSVPHDVSVIGYDDTLLVAFADPPLTTVRQEVAAMSAAAVRALVDEIGGHHSARTEFVFRPELVVRGSTAAARPR